MVGVESIPVNTTRGLYDGVEITGSVLVQGVVMDRVSVIGRESVGIISEAALPISTGGVYVEEKKINKKVVFHKSIRFQISKASFIYCRIKQADIWVSME